MRNIKRTIVAGALAAAIAVAPAAHASHSESGTYTIGTTPVVGIVCSPDCLGVADLNYGGYTFVQNGQTPASAAFDDISAGPVSFTVAQDLDGDGFSGNNDPSLGMIEPRVDGCAVVADLTTSAVPFVNNKPVDVFVTAVDPINCAEGLGLGGTVTITYA